jgi:small subunit ribosomal protein S35
VQAKYDKLEGMCDRGELEAENAYELFKEFEDKMVSEYIKIMDSKNASKDLPKEIAYEGKKDELEKQGKKKVELDDPPGEGPILSWESRVVFAPGGEAWHPKNRKVKLSVTVKELGLSNYACKRLRMLVSKKYNSGRDELTITSERYVVCFLLIFLHFEDQFIFVLLNTALC